MKKCPFCAESIQDEAIKCRYCQSFLEDAPAAKPAPATEAAEAAPTTEASAKSDDVLGALSTDDAWEADAPAAPLKPAVATAPKPAAKPAPVKENPLLLKPEVGSDKPAAAASDEEDVPGRRKVLYSGSPSWRAFFNHYALAAVAAILVPLFCLWIAGLVGAGWFGKTLSVLIPLGMAAIAFLAINIYRKSKVYRVTTTNIESEYGVLSKKIDVLELWRCRDVRYQQSLMDRILRIAHIEVMTADVTTPQLCINGLPASRQLFEQIRDSIEIQRQARNVVGFVQ